MKIFVKTKLNEKLFVTTQSTVNIYENFHIFYVLILVVAMQTLMTHIYDSVRCNPTLKVIRNFKIN